MSHVTPFPAWYRVGHASKVAAQLAKARSHREASHILSRVMTAFIGQLDDANIEATTIERQRIDYLLRIDAECRLIGAGWAPELPLQEKPGGVA